MLTAIGLCYGYAFTSFASIAQQAAPDEMRGRVLAVNFMVLGILFPVGHADPGTDRRRGRLALDDRRLGRRRWPSAWWPWLRGSDGRPLS